MCMKWIAAAAVAAEAAAGAVEAAGAVGSAWPAYKLARVQLWLQLLELQKCQQRLLYQTTINGRVGSITHTA